VRLKYAFIKKHSTDYPVRRLCQTLKVHPSGYYAWLAEPQSARAKEDQRLLGLIKHAWLESGGVYGPIWTYSRSITSPIQAEAELEPDTSISGRITGRS